MQRWRVEIVWYKFVIFIKNIEMGNSISELSYTKPLYVQPITGNGNGSTTFSLNALASTNANLIKNTSGLVFNITAMNTAASSRYLRFYNKATAPTVGTDTPFAVIAIPATSSKEISFNTGLLFLTGIGIAVTGGASVLDSTAVSAGDVQLTINYH